MNERKKWLTRPLLRPCVIMRTRGLLMNLPRDNKRKGSVCLELNSPCPLSVTFVREHFKWATKQYAFVICCAAWGIEGRSVSVSVTCAQMTTSILTWPPLILCPLQLCPVSLSKWRPQWKPWAPTHPSRWTRTSSLTPHAWSMMACVTSGRLSSWSGWAHYSFPLTCACVCMYVYALSLVCFCACVCTLTCLFLCVCVCARVRAITCLCVCVHMWWRTEGVGENVFVSHSLTLVCVFLALNPPPPPFLFGMNWVTCSKQWYWLEILAISPFTLQ